MTRWDTCDRTSDWRFRFAALLASVLVVFAAPSVSADTVDAKPPAATIFQDETLRLELPNGWQRRQGRSGFDYDYDDILRTDSPTYRTVLGRFEKPSLRSRSSATVSVYGQFRGPFLGGSTSRQWEFVRARTQPETWYDSHRRYDSGPVEIRTDGPTHIRVRYVIENLGPVFWGTELHCADEFRFEDSRALRLTVCIEVSILRYLKRCSLVDGHPELHACAPKPLSLEELPDIELDRVEAGLSLSVP